jgi:hypothetical protein
MINASQLSGDTLTVMHSGAGIVTTAGTMAEQRVTLSGAGSYDLFGVLAMLWFLSPLITGLWLGRRLATALGREANDLAALLGGVLLLALLGRLPFVGGLVSLASFVLALGALIVARRAGGGPVAQALGAPLLAPTP